MHVACAHGKQVGQSQGVISYIKIEMYWSAEQALQVHLTPLPSLPHVPARVWPVGQFMFWQSLHNMPFVVPLHAPTEYWSLLGQPPQLEHG